MKVLPLNFLLEILLATVDDLLHHTNIVLSSRADSLRESRGILEDGLTS